MAVSARVLFPLRFPEWQEQYEAALFETDRQKLLKCVAVAELVILNRRQVLVAKVGHEPERLAMSDALRVMRFLKGFTAQ
jgi:hypothetical protein